MMPHNQPQDCTNSAQPHKVTANCAVIESSETTQAHVFGLRGWEWTTQRERAAQLVAEEHIADYDIAATLNISGRTLTLWKSVPEFIARVQAIRKDITNYQKRLLIARKSYRLGNYQRRLLALEQIIELRARANSADPDLPEVLRESGDIGYLVKHIRKVGRNETAVEWVVDKVCLQEMRELEELAAREVGDLVTKVAPTSPDGTQEYRARLSEAEFDKLPLEERIRLLQAPESAQGEGVSS